MSSAAAGPPSPPVHDRRAQVAQRVARNAPRRRTKGGRWYAGTLVTYDNRENNPRDSGWGVQKLLLRADVLLAMHAMGHEWRFQVHVARKPAAQQQAAAGSSKQQLTRSDVMSPTSTPRPRAAKAAQAPATESCSGGIWGLLTHNEHSLSLFRGSQRDRAPSQTGWWHNGHCYCWACWATGYTRHSQWWAAVGNRWGSYADKEHTLSLRTCDPVTALLANGK